MKYRVEPDPYGGWQLVEKAPAPHRWWHRKKSVGWGDGGTWYVCRNKGCVQFGRAFHD